MLLPAVKDKRGEMGWEGSGEKGNTEDPHGNRNVPYLGSINVSIMTLILYCNFSVCCHWENHGISLLFFGISCESTITSKRVILEKTRTRLNIWK